MLFSIVAEPVYIPTNSVQESPFLHNLINTYLFFFLNNSYPNRYEMTSHSFDLHFPDNDIEHLFTYLLAFGMSSLEKYVFTPFAQFFIRLLLFFRC